MLYHITVKQQTKGLDMAKTKQITAEYIKYISQEVVENFGGSYQTYETMGKIWRQELGYKPAVETFVFNKTNLFLHLLDKRDRHDLNSMYNVCDKISNYLSEYLVKKTKILTKDEIKQDSMEKIYFNNNVFVKAFNNKISKRPIDMTNENYVRSNPGVVKMAQYQLGR